MNRQELANKLNEIEYPCYIPDSVLREAKNSGIVILYGSSDDLCEMVGAITDEASCFEGGDLFLNDKGFLEDHSCCDCQYCGFESLRRTARKITAHWCKDGIAWTYETDIPHSVFRVMEDGEVFCLGVVFEKELLT